MWFWCLCDLCVVNAFFLLCFLFASVCSLFFLWGGGCFFFFFLGGGGPPFAGGGGGSASKGGGFKLVATGHAANDNNL